MLNYANLIRNLENKKIRQEQALTETTEHIEALRQQWKEAADAERQAPLLTKEKDGKK